MLIWESNSLSKITLFFELHIKCDIPGKMASLWLNEWLSHSAFHGHKGYLETNGNVNYSGIHRQWHSSRWNYSFVCFQFLIRDISIWCVSEVTILTLIMLMLNYASRMMNQFLVVAVCAMPHICVYFWAVSACVDSRKADCCHTEVT